MVLSVSDLEYLRTRCLRGTAKERLHRDGFVSLGKPNFFRLAYGA
jgi:hypothetical protein